MVYEQINEVLTWKKKTHHMLRFNLLYDHTAVHNVSQLFCWSLSGAGKGNGHVGWSGGFNSGLSCGPVGY